MNLPGKKIAWQLKMHWKEYCRWRNPDPQGSSSGMRVFYGFEKLPAPHEKASGGIIKCQDLADVFPNEKRRPNMLYLVSSALPFHLSVLIQHAKKAGAPVIVNQNGVAYSAWHGPGWEKVNRTLALAHHAADYVLYQSRFCRDSAMRFLGPRKSSHEVLYNAVDTKKFFPSTEKPSRPDPTLLTAGDHLFSYRVLSAVSLLAALHKKMPAVKLLIAGNLRWRLDGKEALHEVEEYAKGLGVHDRIAWIGPYTQEEAPALLRRADILIHPKYNDPCPRLVIEAMASGLPVVFSASGGVPELVGERAGVGVPAPCDYDKTHVPSAEKMAEAVTGIVNSYKEFSEHARKRAVEHFDVKHWLERHKSLFNELRRKAGQGHAP